MTVPVACPIGRFVTYNPTSDVPDTLREISSRYGVSLDELLRFNPQIPLMLGDDAQLDAIQVRIPISDTVGAQEWELHVVATARTLEAECAALLDDPYRYGAPPVTADDVWANVLNVNFRQDRLRGGSVDPNSVTPATVQLAAGGTFFVPHVRHLMLEIAVTPATSHQTAVSHNFAIMPDAVQQLIYEHVIPIQYATRQLADKNRALVTAQRRIMDHLQSLLVVDRVVSSLRTTLFEIDGRPGSMPSEARSTASWKPHDPSQQATGRGRASWREGRPFGACEPSAGHGQRSCAHRG